MEWKSGSSGRGSIPSHPTTSTTTSGGDGGYAILLQQLEWNNSWNKTQQIPKKQTTFYPKSTCNFCLQPIILPLHSQLLLFPTQKFLLFFPGRPCCDKAQQNAKKERKEERMIKYCCTIPFISFARSRLHLNRLNKLKIIHPQAYFQ